MILLYRLFALIVDKFRHQPTPQEKAALDEATHQSNLKLYREGIAEATANPNGGMAELLRAVAAHDPGMPAVPLPTSPPPAESSTTSPPAIPRDTRQNEPSVQPRRRQGVSPLGLVAITVNVSMLALVILLGSKTGKIIGSGACQGNALALNCDSGGGLAGLVGTGLLLGIWAVADALLFGVWMVGRGKKGNTVASGSRPSMAAWTTAVITSLVIALSSIGAGTGISNSYDSATRAGQIEQQPPSAADLYKYFAPKDDGITTPASRPICDAQGPAPGTECDYEEPVEVVVTADSCLKLRSGPGMEFEVQMCVPKGASLFAHGRASYDLEWVHVTDSPTLEFDKINGWGAAEFLEES